MRMDKLNNFYTEPVISEEKLLRIAQYIDIGFSVLLWLTYIFAILASFQHVAWAFSLLESGNQSWVGYLAAAAVDGALATMAYLIQQRRKQKYVAKEIGEETAVEGTYMLWFGLFFLGGISVVANLLHGAHIELDTELLTWANLLQLDGLQWLRLTTNAIALPFIVVFLGEMVGIPGSHGLISNLVRKNKILQESASLLTIVRDDLDQTKTELSEKIKRLTTTESDLTTAEQEVNMLRTTLITTEQEVNTLRAALTTTEQDMNTTSEEANTLRGALTTAEKEVTTLRAALTTAEQEISNKSQKLTDVYTNWKTLKGQFDNLSIPVQETIIYLSNVTNGEGDTQEAAAQRASERLDAVVSRSQISRLSRVLSAETDSEEM